MSINVCKSKTISERPIELPEVSTGRPAVTNSKDQSVFTAKNMERFFKLSTIAMPFPLAIGSKIEVAGEIVEYISENIDTSKIKDFSQKFLKFHYSGLTELVYKSFKGQE